MKKSTIFNLVFILLLGAIFAGLYYLKAEQVLQSFWLLMGFVLGWLLLSLDEMYGQAIYKEKIQTEMPSVSARSLITRSIIFIGAFLVTALFIITSSGQLLGIGMVLGICCILSLEMWQLLPNSSEFHQRFLWQIRRQWSVPELTYLSYGMVGATLVLTLLFFT
ncbi:MAG: hypothetical protein M3Q81_05095 [bacterium]|nr:hypothetical protein [bacterium]